MASWYMDQSVDGLVGIQNKCDVVMEWSLYITQDDQHEPCRFTHKDYLAARVWLHERLGKDILGYNTALELMQCCENRINDLEEKGLVAVMKCQSHPSIADMRKDEVYEEYAGINDGDIPF